MVNMHKGRATLAGAFGVVRPVALATVGARPLGFGVTLDIRHYVPLSAAMICDRLEAAIHVPTSSPSYGL